MSAISLLAMDYDDNHTLFFQSEHRVQEFAFAPVMDPSHSLELTVLDKDLTNNKFIVSVGRGDYVVLMLSSCVNVSRSYLIVSSCMS